MTAPTILPKWSNHKVLDESIRDALAHTSEETDIQDFNRITILAKNTLDQTVGVQWQGAAEPDFADPIDIGAPVALAVGNVNAQYDSTVVTVYYPFYRVIATAGGVPTVGKTEVWIVKGKLI